MTKTSFYASCPGITNGSINPQIPIRIYAAHCRLFNPDTVYTETIKNRISRCIHKSVHAYIFMHMCACVCINDNNQRQKRLSVGE